MTEQWLVEAVAASSLSFPPGFPRDIAAEAPLRHPLDLVGMPGLTVEGVRQWLVQRGLPAELSGADRRLYGCMVARAGAAALFFDSDDSEAEQRFTLAHEVAHYVLDHLLPRTRALDFFGEGILPVLDGEREPRLNEYMDSRFSDVPLGLQVHLMNRGEAGDADSGAVLLAEERADHLALELLAPMTAARAELNEVTVTEGPRRLETVFGLPTAAARTYARMLRKRRRRPEFSVVDFFGDDER
ncbi:ImmA/IrrE family metallo-endopeptidase [Corallococcus exiguus]|uniref:ImmA/IrrE family metallo-endopeptidase n=1 Tax=Corallococcus exiguus TaxID=83462 RepID=UPI001471EB75|nr:ImmA/IrrE family metallo-endopeptidase [Corallococcus exiguus]NNB91363.1 ImmA/IrrE family metallo-endopeptidase [Corallococcus exiguus]NNC08269.1 ImmA/IrrE family metallo-endopeptidase [Corallococcus exiguus]NRD66294.1 ImmA/IrrE family metallo-endopeptidase [Corallococcus exiguus]